MADIKTITEAVCIKVQEVFGPLLVDGADINKDIIYAPQDIAMRKRAEATGGKNIAKQPEKDTYRLEFISVWLEDASFSWDRQRSPLARTGVATNFIGDDNSKIRMLKAIPADLDFSITLWTNYKTKADQFISEYCFLQQDNPQLEFFYEGDKKFEIDVHIQPPIALDDNVSKMYIEGKYWRPQVHFKVDGWFIKDVILRTVKTINLDIYMSENIQLKEPEVLVFSETITETP